MLNTTAWNRLRYSLYAPVYDLVAARPLLEGAGFIVEHDTPVMMGSLFRALLARKA
ncbi:hypothetical protein [Chromohalobacter japonicus]|uniref:hypothetical protein n=1 Tax=Chromohalobacter japonicus TaxID=223900 RepID=UPI003F8DC901